MRIKGMDGQEYNVTSQGQGTYNTVAGSLGIASFLGLNAGNFLGGWNNRGGGAVEVITSDDRPISRYEAKMMQECAAKDAENGLLKSQVYTDQKLSETIKYLQGEIGGVSGKLEAFKTEQIGINREQAVYNGVNTATISCIKGQVAELASLSELVVPQRRVCNTCCGGCNCNN
jgi:hypothetical protein